MFQPADDHNNIQVVLRREMLVPGVTTFLGWFPHFNSDAIVAKPASASTDSTDSTDPASAPSTEFDLDLTKVAGYFGILRLADGRAFQCPGGKELQLSAGDVGWDEINAAGIDFEQLVPVDADPEQAMQAVKQLAQEKQQG